MRARMSLPAHDARSSSSYLAPVAQTPPSNLDLLAWFDEDERSLCAHCGEHTSVGLPDVATSFCLGCGAVSIGGERLDVDGRIAS
jgi:hypothetical protein